MILQEKYDAIRNEGFEEGREKGIQEGVREGIREGIIKTVKLLRELNLNEEEILARLLETYPDHEEIIKEAMRG